MRGDGDKATDAPRTLMLPLFLPLVFAAPPSAEVVAPTFGWQAGERSAVQYEGVTESARDGVTVRTLTRATWTSTVVAAADGLELQVSAYLLTPTTGLPPNDMTGAYVAAAHAAPYALRIGADGTLVERVGMDVVRTSLEGALARTSLPTAAARDQIRAMLPDAQLQAMATDWWESLIGAWRGTTFQAGEVATGTVPTPVPALGNQVVDLRLEVAWLGPAPCVEGEPVPLCSRFQVTSGLEESQVTAALETMVRRVAAAQGDPNAPRITGLEMSTVTTLLTRADGLRPVRLEVARTTRLMGTQAGASFDVTQGETRRWTFTPSPAP